MVDSTYQQSFAGNAGDGSDEDALVQDDELLIGEQPVESAAPRWSAVSRTRRSSGSQARYPVARAGDVIAGKYRVENVAGRSGPEMVVFARHLELEQRVRLRYLLPEAYLTPDAIARFQRGARRARDMRSEHAERIIDFGRLETGSPYRVSEVPGGPALDEILRVRGALEIRDAVDIVLSACEPVAEAHASGVVHRSLCTGNVFVERRADGSQFVTVLDFGVSDPLEHDPARGEFTNVASLMSTDGPLAYTSPEQIRNPSAVDGRADVWALGAILYELLTGVRVFVAETQLTLFAMIAADQPAPINWLRPEVPEALEATVLACLEKDPDGRPRSVVELASTLSPFGSGNAPNVASRVARVAMRNTRPPPFPSAAPPSMRLPLTTRAIVRTPPPPVAPPELPKSMPLPGWAMLAGGALMGTCAALAFALALRQLAPIPVSPVAAPVAAPVTPQALPTATVAATSTVPTALPVVSPAPAAPPRTAAPPRPAKRAESKPEREATSTERAAAERESAPERTTASRTARVSTASEPARGERRAAPKALFEGIE
jgi:serine/threonine-protein kinase